MSVVGKVINGRSKVRCDGCGRISSDRQSGYYFDKVTQRNGTISSKGRACEHDFCNECEAQNSPAPECPKCPRRLTEFARFVIGITKPKKILIVKK
jgi:hypothetical protein